MYINKICIGYTRNKQTDMKHKFGLLECRSGKIDVRINISAGHL
jgi:hypothetical protein